MNKKRLILVVVLTALVTLAALAIFYYLVLSPSTPLPRQILYPVR